MMVFKLIFYGCFAAGLSYIIYQWFSSYNFVGYRNYSLFFAPVTEEILKALFVIYLIRRNRIGFMVDAAICGFAIGAGFSLTENIYYLEALRNSNIFIWIIRGFGTAIMHGSSTSIFAILSKYIFDRTEMKNFYSFIPGLTAAILIHAFFNQFLLSPIVQTIAQFFVLPFIVYFVFQKSEIALRYWLEAGLDTEVSLLEQINNGKFSETNSGKYLSSLQNSFSGTVLADMLCYIKIYLELAVKAKGFLMLKEAGINPKIENDVEENITEMKYLENQIGKTALLALKPIISSMPRDIWQLNMIKNIT